MSEKQVVAGFTADSLFEAVAMDMWPSPAAVVDFGIDSQKHYEALYGPIREGDITKQDLRKVMGDGEAITKLVNRFSSNPHRNKIVFKTSYDLMASERKIASELLSIAKSLTAGGWKHYSEDLSDIIEGQALSNEGSSVAQIVQIIKKDAEIVKMMKEEGMSDRDLKQCISESQEMFG